MKTRKFVLSICLLGLMVLLALVVNRQRASHRADYEPAGTEPSAAVGAPEASMPTEPAASESSVVASGENSVPDQPEQATSTKDGQVGAAQAETDSISTASTATSPTPVNKPGNLAPLAGLAEAEQRRANEEANKFVLPVRQATSPDDEGGEVPVATSGLIRPTPEQAAAERAQGRAVKKVLLNKIGLARINAERAQKGLAPLVAGRDVQVAPVGKDIVTAPAREIENRDKVGGASGGADLQAGAPTAVVGEEPAVGEAAPAGEEPPLGEVPASVNNSTLQYFPPIKNQGSLGSCAAWSEIWYNLTHEIALQRNWDAKSGGDFYRFSPLFTYNFENEGQDTGTSPGEHFTIARYHGAVRKSEKSSTTDYTSWLRDNPDAYKRALSARTDGYVGLPDLDTVSGLQALKQHLANGHIGEYATYVSSWYFKTVKDDPSTTNEDAYVGKNVAYKVAGKNGAHGMTVVGYNDDIWCDLDNDSVVDSNEKGALRIANSYGTGYEDGGYCWVAYQALVTRNTSDTGSGIFWGDLVRVIVPKEELYEPKLVAKVTYNHNTRNQLSGYLGVSATNTTSPTTTLTSSIVNYQGGSLAFSGAAPAYQDFSYYLDFTDALPALGTAQRYYLVGADSGADNGNLTIKSFELFSVTGGVERLVGWNNTPVVVNGSTKSVWIDWIMGNDAPVVGWTVNSQSSTNESGTITVTARLSEAQAQDLSVPFTVSGTASSGADYSLSASSVLIQAGATTGSVTITISADTVHEYGNETVVLNMGAPSLTNVFVCSGIGLHTATITDDDNSTPMVNAGPDKAYFAVLSTSPGLWYGEIPSSFDINLTTSNPKATLLTNVASYTENVMANNSTEIYTGQIYDADGSISFTENIDDKAMIWIDGVLKLSSDTWADRKSTGNLNLTPGWHDIEIRIWNGTGGSGPVSSPGIGFDPNGGTAWRTLQDPGNGSLLRVSNGYTVNLDGTANDADSDVLTTSWTLISGPIASTIANTAAVDTGVILNNYGVYTFRLTVNDGYGAVSDDVVITYAEMPTVAWTAASQISAGESGTMTVTAQLSAAHNQNVTLPFTVTGTATSGTDYTITASSISIAAGATTGTVTITVTSDSIHERNGETVILTLGTPTNATLGTINVHTATIMDDDNIPPVVDAGPVQAIQLSDSIMPWTPAQIATTGWYDAADTGTITASSGAASQWRDKSGYNLHLSQGAAANQPTTGATINGHNALDFTGDVMTTDSNPFGTTVSNAFVIAVHKIDSTANGTLFSLTGSENAANRWNAHAPYGGTMYFDCGAVAESNRISASYGVSAGNVVLASFYCSTTNNVQQAYKNGTLLIGDSSGHAVSTTGNIMVGGFASGYQDTTIGELIVINGTVDAATREKLEGYLAHKWSLTANLPEGHPYKSAAPSGIGLAAVANLDGTVSDANGDPLTTTWTLDAGPAGVSIGSASALDTTATFSVAGNYTLRLTANDTYAPVSDDVVITVITDGNTSPTISNIADISTSEDTATRAIDFTIGDAETAAASLTVSGTSNNTALVPNSNIVFGGSGTNRTVTITPAANQSGTATITVTVNDGKLTASDTFVLTVNAVNTPPNVNAGSDQTLIPGTPIPWTPVQISTAGWYDAADASTITASAGAVSQWRDKSGNGRHAAQATASLQPTTGSAINGKNALSFPGSATKVLTTSFNQLTTSSIYMVVDANAKAVNNNNCPFGATTGWNAGGTYITLQDYSKATAGHAVHYGANQVAGRYLNGTYQSTAHGFNPCLLSHQGTALSTQNLTYRIGTSRSDNGEYYSGTIGEIIICPADHDAATRQKMEGYLAHKWGLTANLPAGHPYKSAAPTVPAATANLDGTVSDIDTDPLTTTWTIVSTVPTGLPVTLGNASAVDTTATFTQAGTYTFRLTANDGSGPVSDDVVITVNPASAYDAWVTAANLGVGVDATFNGDANGDGMANGLAWLLGSTNPNENGNLLMPQAAENAGNLSLFFKMLNSTKRGAAVLSLQYSNDLGVSDPWTNHTIPVPDISGPVSGVNFVIAPISGTDHNQVQVTIPASAAGETGKVFARMSGILEP